MLTDAELKAIKARHELHGKDSIAGVQTRYAWAHQDRATLLAEVERLQKRAEEKACAHSDMAVMYAEEKARFAELVGRLNKISQYKFMNSEAYEYFRAILADYKGTTP